MKVTFTGVPGEKHDSVHMYGQDFPLNKAVDVKDPFTMRKLRNHPHFKAEASRDDEQLDAQVRQEYSAAAQAGLMDAQARAIREGRQAPQSAAPSPIPSEPNLRPMRSATEYVERVEQGAGAGLEQLTEEQLEQQLQARRAEREAREAMEKKAQSSEAQHSKKESTDDHADAQRAGGKGAAQAPGAGPAGTGETGRSGKSR